jgi:hypothetical protein
MLDKATAAQEVLRRLRKMEAGDSLELLTWKKDRSQCGLFPDMLSISCLTNLI